MYVVDRDTGNPICLASQPKGKRALGEGHLLVPVVPPDPASGYKWNGSEWEATAEYVDQTARRARRRAYPPIGDQLDAIWKALNQQRLDGVNLPQEADDMLGRILAVKRDIPIPGE